MLDRPLALWERRLAAIDRELTRQQQDGKSRAERLDWLCGQIECAEEAMRRFVASHGASEAGGVHLTDFVLLITGLGMRLEEVKRGD